MIELPPVPLFPKEGEVTASQGALSIMEIFNKATTKEKRKNLRKNQTEAELAMWQKVRGKRFLGCKFFRQYGIGEYIADFYCPQHKLVIEIDGSQHFSDDGKEYDKSRERYMNSLSISTIRFSNLDVLRNIDGVLSQIEQEISKRNSP